MNVSKIKERERILKGVREKKIVTYKENTLGNQQFLSRDPTGKETVE